MREPCSLWKPLGVELLNKDAEGGPTRQRIDDQLILYTRRESINPRALSATVELVDDYALLPARRLQKTCLETLRALLLALTALELHSFGTKRAPAQARACCQ